MLAYYKKTHKACRSPVLKSLKGLIEQLLLEFLLNYSSEDYLISNYVAYVAFNIITDF